MLYASTKMPFEHHIYTILIIYTLLSQSFVVTIYAIFQPIY